MAGMNLVPFAPEYRVFDDVIEKNYLNRSGKRLTRLGTGLFANRVNAIWDKRGFVAAVRNREIVETKFISE
jgi:hypothetical protein